VRVASHTFRPPAWATVGLVLSCSLFCVAGFWQLDRADEKRRLLSEYDSSGVGDMLTAPIALGPTELEANRYRPMRLTGRYDSDRQFLLDSMMSDGKVGYHVLTPLVGGETAVLVNRGWVPANPDRSILPDIDVGTENREISGLIAPLPRPGMRSDPEVIDATAGWPRRLLFPEMQALRAQLDHATVDYQLLLDDNDADGYRRDWRPTTMNPDKHLAYAVQWFGFAVTMCVIYVVVNLSKSSEEQTE
jgi:surfeit locus 1 family protein